MTVEMTDIALGASIASPLVAVFIAWWTSISSAKDTAKQIAALEESTTKQIESKNQKEIIISITSLSMTLRISEKVLSRIRRN